MSDTQPFLTRVARHQLVQINRATGANKQSDLSRQPTRYESINKVTRLARDSR